MNANTFTFGVELEVACPNNVMNDHGLRIGAYHVGTQVPFLPAGWTAQKDASLSAGVGYTPCEIVSPILRGAEGIDEVIRVLAKLNELGFKIAQNSGFHCHVGWNDAWGAETLARLISIFSYLERGLFSSTGTKKRERGTYCKGVRKHGSAPKAKKELDPDRYNALNISNLANNYTHKKTVEFRLFSGSLNATKIVGWIQLCLGVVEKSLNTKRLPAWTPAKAKCFWAKKGEGQTELERMLSYLGWSTGYAKNAEGKEYGIVTDTIPLKEIKKELRRLAKKYDAEP